MLLWELRDNILFARFGIARLRSIVAKSAMIDSTGKVSLTLRGFMWVAVKVIFDMLEILEPRETLKEKQTQEIISGVNALKRFGALNDKSRLQIVSLLCHYLSGDGCKSKTRDSESEGCLLQGSHMPPKDKGAVDPEDSFMFVNEDLQTLFGDTKNSDIDRSKQSHVQRQSFAKRRRGARTNDELLAAPLSPRENLRSRTERPGSQIVRSQFESRTPYLSLPLSESVWLPTIPDEEGDAPQVQSTLLQPRPEILRWRPSQTTWTSADFFNPPLPQHGQLEIPTYDASQPLSRGSVPQTNAITSEIQKADQSVANALPPIAPLDPFSNMQIALDLWVPPLMKYYTKNIISEFFFLDLKATSLHSMRHVEYLHADMRSCMANPSEMYALLVASACHALSRDGRIDLPGVSWEDGDRVTLLLKSQAFKALRIRLASGVVSHGTVMAIQRLITAAVYTDSFATVEAHYRAAMSMVKQIGGLYSFNDFQKEQLVMHDLYFALSSDNLPEFEATWDPGPFTTNMSYDVYKNTTNRGASMIKDRFLQTASKAGITLFPVVTQALPELAETQCVLGWLRSHPYRPADYQWLTQRRLAIANRLLSGTLPYSSSTGSGADLQSFFHLAIICYMVLTRIVPFSGTVLAKKYILPALTGRTATALETVFHDTPDLLLWALSMWGVTLALSTDQLFEHDEELHQIRLLTEKVGRGTCLTLSVVSETQLRSLLSTILFDDEMMDERYMFWIENGLGLARD